MARPSQRLRLPFALLLATIASSLAARAPFAAPSPRSPPASQRDASPTTEPSSAPIAAASLPALACPAGDAAARALWLSHAIDAVLASPGLAGVHVGLAVADTATGRLIVERHASDGFNVASNAKLVTSAAALALLGPDYRWRTELYAPDLASRGGVVHGDLYLRGGGDPSLVSEDLLTLAAELALRGVRRIDGGIVVDDRFFDDVRDGPDFDDKTEDGAFRAPSGAASVDYNAVTIAVAPGPTVGAPVRVTITPASTYVAIAATATTSARGDSLTVTANATAEKTVVTVTGTLPLRAAAVVFHKRIDRPDLFTGAVLAADLARLGVHLASKEVRDGVVPDGASALVVHLSPPLSTVLRDMDKESNNFMAEQVLKTIGAASAGPPGSWDKGVAAVARYLASIGLPPGSYVYRNGSGLYGASRFAPDAIVRLLVVAYHDFRFSADFLSALAVAGEDGTIAHRMLGTIAARLVRAKTGTLENVSCLSGYAGDAGLLPQPPLAFAIFMNDVPRGKRALARLAQDAIAERLVEYLAAGGK